MVRQRSPSSSRVLVPVLSIALGVLCVVAAVRAFGTPSNQCDNMAGTCIRFRQQAAILVIQLLCLAGAVASGFVAFGWGRWHRFWTGLAVAVLIAGTTASVLVLVADPINHLNDRWGGWLGV